MVSLVILIVKYVRFLWHPVDKLALIFQLQVNFSEVHTVQAGHPDNVPQCLSVKQRQRSGELKYCHLFRY